MSRFVIVQRGMAVMSALFVLVVLAVLGALMLTFSNTQHLTAAQDVRGARAYWAARVGLEWAVPQIVASNSCPAAATFPVEGFDVQVSCSQATYSDGGTVNIFRITALACQPGPCGAAAGSSNYVERSVSASLER